MPLPIHVTPTPVILMLAITRNANARNSDARNAIMLMLEMLMLEMLMPIMLISMVQGFDGEIYIFSQHIQFQNN